MQKHNITGGPTNKLPAFNAFTHRDENGTDIFRPYSRPNSFRGVQICPYPSPNIQHLIPYPYPNT